MTLNEKLSLISDLENERLSEELIASIVEQVENPEPSTRRYKNVKELLDSLESDEA